MKTALEGRVEDPTRDLRRPAWPTRGYSYPVPPRSRERLGRRLSASLGAHLGDRLGHVTLDLLGILVCVEGTNFGNDLPELGTLPIDLLEPFEIQDYETTAATTLPPRLTTTRLPRPVDLVEQLAPPLGNVVRIDDLAHGLSLRHGILHTSCARLSVPLPTSKRPGTSSAVLASFVRARRMRATNQPAAYSCTRHPGSERPR